MVTPSFVVAYMSGVDVRYNLHHSSKSQKSSPTLNDLNHLSCILSWTMHNIHLLESYFLCISLLFDKTHFTSAVATPRWSQGVPRNTLTWKKKKIIYNNLNFFICLPLKNKIETPSKLGTLSKIFIPNKFWTKI